MTERLDPLSPPERRSPVVAGWTVERRQAYILSRREKYTVEIITPVDPTVRPNEVSDALSGAHPILRVALHEKGMIVWMFLTEIAADLFEQYYDHRVLQWGGELEYPPQRTTYL